MQIPFITRSEKNKAVVRCFKKAADRAGVSEFKAGMVLLDFLEAICDEVAQGNVVSIPGFGAFGPYVWQPRIEGQQRFVLPSFSGARPFRNLTKNVGCVERAQEGHDYMSRHRRNHHTSSKSTALSSVPLTTFDTFRKHMRAQADRVAMDC